MIEPQIIVLNTKSESPSFWAKLYWRCLEYFFNEDQKSWRTKSLKKIDQTLDTRSNQNAVGKYDGRTCLAIVFSHIIFLAPTIPMFFRAGRCGSALVCHSSSTTKEHVFMSTGLNVFFENSVFLTLGNVTNLP